MQDDDRQPVRPTRLLLVHGVARIQRQHAGPAWLDLREEIAMSRRGIEGVHGVNLRSEGADRHLSVSRLRDAVRLICSVLLTRNSK